MPYKIHVNRGKVVYVMAQVARQTGGLEKISGKMTAKSGTNPKIGQLLATGVSEDDALEILGNVIRLYCTGCDLSQKSPRVSHIIEKMGLDEFKALVMSHE